MAPTSAEIEQEIQRLAGVQTVVQIGDREVVLTGMVDTEGERQAVIDVVTELLPGHRLVDDLELVAFVPDEVGGVDIEDAAVDDWPGTAPEAVEPESIEPGDFTDQEILGNPEGGRGSSGTVVDVEISEGEQVWVPPIDPVRSLDSQVLGGFALSSDERIEVPRSPLDNDLGDEAIADTIRLELREDSATTDLELEVEVENGTVTLRGLVPTVDDAENAEAVPFRVPGVIEVVDEMEIATL